MRTSLRICMVVGSMSVLLVAGPAVQAQSLPYQPVVMPGQAPPSLPGYGAPYGMAPVAMNAYGQPVPVYGQPIAAPVTRTAGMTRSENGQTKPAYRVTVVGNEQQAQKKHEPQQKQKKDEPQQEQKAPMFDDASCKAVDCGQKSCGHVGECCCNPYNFRVYGEFLYLRARDAEVCYAVELRLLGAGHRAGPDIAHRRAGSGLLVRLPRGFWFLPG